MSKTKIESHIGPFTGTDRGNPGLDMLGQRLDNSHYSDEELRDLARFDWNSSIPRRKERSKKDKRLAKAGKYALVGAGIAASAVALGRYAGDDQKPMRHQIQSIDYVGEGVQPGFVGGDTTEIQNK